jgi:hypothetical protein
MFKLVTQGEKQEMMLLLGLDVIKLKRQRDSNDACSMLIY